MTPEQYADLIALEAGVIVMIGFVVLFWLSK